MATGLLHADETAWSETMSLAREEYLTRGFCHLKNFLSAEMCAEMSQEVSKARKEGEFFKSSETHTVYQEEQDATLPGDHPRNQLQESAKVIVDYDRVATTSPLRSIYTNPRMLELVRKTTAVPELHLSACPYNAAYLNEFTEGDGLGWHFDRSEFGVNLVLQAPGQGAAFGG